MLCKARGRYTGRDVDTGAWWFKKWRSRFDRSSVHIKKLSSSTLWCPQTKHFDIFLMALRFPIACWLGTERCWGNFNRGHKLNHMIWWCDEINHFNIWQLFLKIKNKTTVKWGWSLSCNSAYGFSGFSVLQHSNKSSFCDYNPLQGEYGLTPT